MKTKRCFLTPGIQISYLSVDGPFRNVHDIVSELTKITRHWFKVGLKLLGNTNNNHAY